MSILTRIIEAIAPRGFQDAEGFHLGEPVAPENFPGSDRQHFADQRLERRGFGEGAQSSNHRSASK